MKRYRMEIVDRLPDERADGVIYFSPEFEMATLSCPCGQRHRIDLLIGDGHTLSGPPEEPTIYPSIGAWAAPCKSHFWISDGVVIPAAAWSDERIERAMKRQIARHVANETLAKPSILRRTMAWLQGLLRF